MGQISKNNNHQVLPPLSAEEKKKFCELARYFSRAVSMAHDFGIAHPLVKQPTEQFFNYLNLLLQQKENITFYIAEKKLRYGETILEENNPVVDKLIGLFSTIKLVSIEFQRGFTHQDLVNLLSVLAIRAQDITDSGGIEKLINEKNIAHLKLNPIRYELIGMHDKVVSKDTKLAETDLEELERKLAEWEKKQEIEEPVTKEAESLKEEEIRHQDELLSLIDPVLREDADSSLFTEKLSIDPLGEVNAIIAAIHLVNKVGGKKAQTFVASINKKLNLFRDGLYQCLIEGKEDEATKQLYKAGEILGKNLSPQIKTIQLSEDLKSLIEEMVEVLRMITNQTEAQKLLGTFLKGKMSLKKKAELLKKINQYQKTSADFEFLMRKLLVLKGLPEEEVKRLFEEKTSILEQAKKEKTSEMEQELLPLLQKLAEKQIDVDTAITAVKELLKKRKQPDKKSDI